MANRDGLLVVLSGPAGSGKSTLVERLIGSNAHIRRAVTATTRAPRPGEVQDIDYHFLSREEFERRVAAEEFLEYTIFNGNFYGTPHRELKANIDRGGVVVLVIEVDGAESIKFFFPNAVFIFIVPPTQEVLRQRLEGRGTESKEDVEKRLVIATREMQRIGEYDYLIINDDPNHATLDLGAVIRAVHRSRINGNEIERWNNGYYSGMIDDDAQI